MIPVRRSLHNLLTTCCGSDVSNNPCAYAKTLGGHASSSSRKDIFLGCDGSWSRACASRSLRVYNLSTRASNFCVCTGLKTGFATTSLAFDTWELIGLRAFFLGEVRCVL